MRDGYVYTRPTRALELLTAARATRTADGRVHLPLADGTTASGILQGCSASWVLLDTRAVPTERLEDVPVS